MRRWGIVFPREADATVHLDVEVGVVEERIEGVDGGDTCGPARTGRGRRSPPEPAVPVAAVASSVATSMLAQWCFHRLEQCDGPPELMTLRGIVSAA